MSDTAKFIMEQQATITQLTNLACNLSKALDALMVWQAGSPETHLPHYEQGWIKAANHARNALFEAKDMHII